MRIDFESSGGLAYFPGLAGKKTINGDQLPSDQAAELARLVTAANFFDLPSVIEAPPGAADYKEYTITVQEGARQHTVSFPETLDHPGLKALVNYIRLILGKA
jgi:hypothetical protein